MKGLIGYQEIGRVQNFYREYSLFMNIKLGVSKKNQSRYKSSG
ncbi:hypothetical protein [Clostridium beijerinckii]|nr:hypothetical protein [Clostridium beijerinckii]MDG5857067.1 hypothetical protein [Clostridium beijerinckii]